MNRFISRDAAPGNLPSLPSRGEASRARWLTALLGAIAFVNAVAVVIVFPLAPFMAADLGVPAPLAAWTSTAFTAAAGVGGLAGALLLGGWTRRATLLATLAGVGLGSLAAALAPGFATLLLARILGGLCSGPLVAVVVTIAAEAVPEARRNAAIGAVIAMYGLALVLGLPAALLLYELGGWRLPMLLLALTGLLLLVPAWRLLPRHVAAEGRVTLGGVLRLLARPSCWTGLALIFCASFGTLIVAPHISAYALGNVGLGATGLQMVYLVGGALAVVSTRTTGWAMDRFGAMRASLTVGAALSLVLIGSFLVVPPPLLGAPLLGLVLALQLGRSTVAQASATGIARGADRLPYQCLVSATASLSQGAGAGFSTLLVHQAADGRLTGMPVVALLSIGFCWLPALLLRLLRRQLRAPIK